MKLNRFLAALLLAIHLIHVPLSAAEQPISSTEIDLLVSGVMEEFQVPGMAIGVIKDGEIVHAKGCGVRQLGRSLSSVISRPQTTGTTGGRSRGERRLG